MCARCGPILGALLLLAPAGAAGQTGGELPPTFTSDRPGFARGTGVAARGHLTAEMGIGASFGEAPAGSFPGLSLRVGLLDWLEARARLPSGAGVFDAAGPRFGLDDPTLGFKVGGRLGGSVALSADVEVSLPLGTDGFHAPEAGFRADLNLDWGFWGPLSLTPNLVASVLAVVDPATLETSRVFEGGGSLRLAWQALEVLGLYVQSYALKSETSGWRVQVGGGLAWRVAPGTQVDASFDAGVTRAGEPPTARLGATVLF